MHSENEDKRGEAAPRRLSGRGLAYWSDNKESRILYITPGYRLVALDAKNGSPVHGFGKDGIVDLKEDFDQQIDLTTGEVGLHAAPVVAGDTIVIGAAHDARRCPRCDAASLRQGDRSRRWRRLHAGAADRIADDLSRQWQAYLTVAISGGTYTGEVLTFRLPN
jgi:glucose dehydrogenase